MRVLIHGINYAPEPTGIGKYTGEMAAWLASQGHEVRVVAAPPYYPQWRISPQHPGGNRYRTESAGGVAVWRVPLWVPKRPSGAKRVLHLASFALMALPVMLRQVFWRPDVVWVAAPAFACTPGALLTARLSGAKAWLHVQDYEIDVAFDMGLLRGKRRRRIVETVERWVMRRFDVVSSISTSMVGRAVEKGVARNRAVMFCNWVDVQAIRPLAGESPYRRELGIAPDAVVAQFSGTLGAKQGLHLIPAAARLLAERCPQLVFVVCGEGVMKEAMEEAARKLPNLRVLPLQPMQRMGEFLGLADLHLLPQDPGVADLVMPSKLTAMLSSGRPVVTTARAGSEAADVVRLCGLVTPPDDAVAFAAAIERLAQDHALRASLGRAARAYAQRNLASDAVLARFDAGLRALARGSRGVPEGTPAPREEDAAEVDRHSASPL